MERRQVPEELVPLVEGGVASWLATCSADNVPEATRVRGARVGETRRRITVFVPTEQAGVTFENLRDGAPIAVFFCRISDMCTVQLKGVALSIRPSSQEDRDLQARCMRAYIEASVNLIPPELLERHVYWPSMAIDIRVDELFAQTPGPGAGRPWP